LKSLNKIYLHRFHISIVILLLVLFTIQPVFNAVILNPVTQNRPENVRQSENGKLIVINKTDNSVVIGYDVTLENTVITYKNLKIFIHDNVRKSRKNLISLIHVLTKAGAGSDDLINIITILHRAGTLSGKLVVT